MARNKTQEVDASSIADIAFILLAFIIIITTLQKEEGIPSVLPQKREVEVPPEVKSKERNILEILVNADDQIMIEGEWDKALEDIKPVMLEFMTNKNNAENMPEMQVIDLQTCNYNIQILKEGAEKGDQNDATKLKDWENKKRAVELLGTFRTLPKSGAVLLQYDKQTSYGTYISVYDQVMAGLNELRNQEALRAFGISYSDLEKIREEVRTPEQNEQIKAIREKYPQKILNKVRNVGQ